MRLFRSLTCASFLLAALSSCTKTGDIDQDTFRLKLAIANADGSPLDPNADPLCLDLRGDNPDPACGYRSFQVTVTAIGLDSSLRETVDTSFNSYVRIGVLPGTVLEVNDIPGNEPRVDGRNVKLVKGVAPPVLVTLGGTYGNTHITAEDLGYVPLDPLSSNRPPLCSDGKDNDNDGLVDYPADPGCAYANDDTERTGSFASGISPVIAYQLPTVAEVQGLGPTTPFSEEGVSIDTSSPGTNVIVTRVSSSGFYVSDVTATTSGQLTTVTTKDWGHLYIFNFGPPDNLRVCDRLNLLSGTMSERFGETQMSFPSWDAHFWDFREVDKGGDGPCLVPEPIVLDKTKIADATYMEKIEGALVRIAHAHIASNFGARIPASSPQPINSKDSCPYDLAFTFTPEASNCDLNGDGQVDFTSGNPEAICSCECYQNKECSEWSAFRSRGNFRVILADAAGPADTMQVNLGEIPGFTPNSYAGAEILAVTGTLDNFSGGSLNWTINARCSDDLAFCAPADTACIANPPTPKSSQQACVLPRIVSDNDSATN
ncbi:MAG: hypothetical protein U0165_19780 [Polyangiaceae bacterium]